MPQTTSRPLTPEERASLEATPQAGTPAQKRAALAFSFAIPVAFLLLPLLRAVLPAGLPGGGLAALLLALVGGGAVGWLVAGRLVGATTPAGFEGWEAALREAAEKDLAAGTAAVTRYRVRGAVKIDYGDGDSTWMLHVDDGRVLDVEGDEVAEALEEGRFPSSEVSVVRTAASGKVLSIEPRGEPIDVDFVRAPLTDEEIAASDQRPDGREETWDEVVAAAKRHPLVPGPRPEERWPRGDRPGRPPEGPVAPPPSNEPIRPR